MTDERFREEAVAQYKNDVITQVREISTVRGLFPVNEAIAASDNSYIYYKLKESSQIQYNFELVTPEFNTYATEKVTVPIPVLQGDLAFSRHERGRLAKDVIPIDIRTRECIADMVEEEEKIAIYGHDNVAGGAFSLSDTTNVTTVASDEIDLGTFIEAVQHWYTSEIQLRLLLKNKFKTGPLKVVMTTDVEARAKAIEHTYNGQTFWDWMVDTLARHNGSNGSDDIVVSNYLGSATNAGATNFCMFVSSPQLMELITSPVEIIQGDTPQNDLQIQIDWRFKPVFYYGNDVGIYHGTAVLTA